MANGRRKRWGWITLGALVIVLLVVAVAGRRKAPTVETVTITRENLKEEITSNGKVEPINPVIVRAQFATFVDKVPGMEGQAVHRGQLILTLTSADLRAQLADARSKLLSAQTQLRDSEAGGPPEKVAEIDGEVRQADIQVTSLQHTVDVLQDLLAKHAATRDELDRNETALAAAKAQQETARQKKEDLRKQAMLGSEDARLRIQQVTDQIHSLEAKVKSAEIEAPLNGTLYSLPVKVGDYVMVGQILAEMADLRRVRVRAFVDEPDLGSLAPGEAVQISWDARPNAVWTGRTEQVPKQVVPLGNRSVGEVLCSIDNAQLELLPNVNVAVRILVQERPDAVVVPRVAVQDEGRNHYVFTVSDGHLRRQPINVGIASTGKYEVLSGLSPGESVALPGDMELRNGMAVRSKELQE